MQKIRYLSKGRQRSNSFQYIFHLLEIIGDGGFSCINVDGDVLTRVCETDREYEIVCESGCEKGCEKGCGKG